MSDLRLSLLTLFILFNVACSSHISDPEIGGNGGTGVLYKPQITLLNFNYANYYKSEETYKILFKVKDDVFGVNESVVEYKTDTEDQWHLIQDKVLSTTEKVIEVLWNIPKSLNGTNFRIRVTTYGKAPAKVDVVSAETFVIDNDYPILASSGLNVATLEVGNPFKFFNVINVANMSDVTSGVGKICLKNDSSSLSLEDSCWTQFENSSSLKIPIYTSIIGTSFDGYLQVTDKAGNIREQTSTVGTDKFSISTTAITVPSNSDSFYKASTSADVEHHLGLTYLNSTSSYVYNNFSDNTSKALNPGKIVVLPSGSVLLREPAMGIRKIDLLNICGAEPCNRTLVGVSINPQDGDVNNGTAKLVAPQRMFLDSSGLLWILDKKNSASSDLVIRVIDFKSSQPQLVTVIGGGESNAENIVSPFDLKITNFESLLLYGTFQSLPNGWFVFSDSDVEKVITNSSDSQAIFRIYKPKENIKIQTLKLKSSTSVTSGRQLIISSSAAVKYDNIKNDIENIFVRVCEVVAPVKSGGDCLNSKVLIFDNEGNNNGDYINIFTSGGNFNIISYNGTDIFGISGVSAEFKKLNLQTGSWENIAGTGVYGNSFCNNNTSISSCNLRMRDAFYDNFNKISYILDSNKIRFVTPDTSRIYSLIE